MQAVRADGGYMVPVAEVLVARDGARRSRDGPCIGLVCAGLALVILTTASVNLVLSNSPYGWDIVLCAVGLGLLGFGCWRTAAALSGLVEHHLPAGRDARRSGHPRAHRPRVRA
ncbi:MAG: hypothetical protein ACR2F6_09735 [Mycobacteriales bacterium]